MVHQQQGSIQVRVRSELFTFSQNIASELANVSIWSHESLFVSRGEIMNGSKSIVPFGNSFDRVRVRATPVTEAAGLAGHIGQVYGETRPSSSGIKRTEIVGELQEDYAVNVQFDELKKSVWLTRDLLEFVDHAPGTQITAGGLTRVRTATGDWVASSTEPKLETAPNVERGNRWVKIIVGIVVLLFLAILLTRVIKHP